MTPNKNRIKELVEALRSDEYQQSCGQLRDFAGFCCLGVGCDLYRKKKGGEWIEGLTPSGKELMAFDPGSIGDKYTLPTAVQEWFGFEDSDPNVEIPAKILTQHPQISHSVMTLGSLNDQNNIDFEDISRVLEYNYLE